MVKSTRSTFEIPLCSVRFTSTAHPKSSNEALLRALKSRKGSPFGLPLQVWGVRVIKRLPLCRTAIDACRSAIQVKRPLRYP